MNSTTGTSRYHLPNPYLVPVTQNRPVVPNSKTVRWVLCDSHFPNRKLILWGARERHSGTMFLGFTSIVVPSFPSFGDHGRPKPFTTQNLGQVWFFTSTSNKVTPTLQVGLCFSQPEMPLSVVSCPHPTILQMCCVTWGLSKGKPEGELRQTQGHPTYSQSWLTHWEELLT